MIDCLLVQIVLEGCSERRTRLLCDLADYHKRVSKQVSLYLQALTGRRKDLLHFRGHTFLLLTLVRLPLNTCGPCFPLILPLESTFLYMDIIRSWRSENMVVIREGAAKETVAPGA